MVDVVQLVERQIVVLVVVGSSPIVHPTSYYRVFFYAHLRYMVKPYLTAAEEFSNEFHDPNIFRKNKTLWGMAKR